MIGNDTASYPVKGKIEYIPSKLSESIGTRVYSKLRKPYGIFFRNPSMSGIYSENLEPGEIEFVFSVRKKQIPFIGGIKVLNLVPDNEGYLHIRELQYASYEYSLMSKDLSCNFNNVADSQSRRPWDKEWYIDKETDDLYNKLQGTANEEGFEQNPKSPTTYYRFRLWLEQRRKAYYEGYKCNRNLEDPNPHTWSIYINVKEEVCFNEVKLELAKEYWWMQRIGFVKVPIVEGESNTLLYEMNLDAKHVKIKLEEGIIKFEYDTNTALIEMVKDSKFTNCIASIKDKMYEDEKAYNTIALTPLKFNTKLNNSCKYYNDLRKNSKLFNIGQEASPNEINYGYTGNKDLNLSAEKWPLTGNKLDIEPIYKTIIIFDKDLIEYQDYYFMSSDNDDDNNDLVKAYIDSFFDPNEAYKGGIINSSGNYLSNMIFKRPFDIKSKKYNEVLSNTNDYKCYKCKIKMHTPGELYYIGIMLLHKQYMITGSEGPDASLNSDIVVTPMISRPNVPDWVDDGDTMKDFLSGFVTSDRENATNLFSISCLNSLKAGSSYGKLFKNAFGENYNVVRQIAGRNYKDAKEEASDQNNKNSIMENLGDVWHISISSKEMDYIQKVDPLNPSENEFSSDLKETPLTSEGVVILNGGNTTTVEIGLIWILTTSYKEIAYKCGNFVNDSKAKIENFDIYDVYIQAPYYNQTQPATIHYIKLLRNTDYPNPGINNQKLVIIDDYGGEKGGTTNIAYKDKIIDTVQLSINNRSYASTINTDIETVEKSGDVYKINNTFNEKYPSIIRINTNQFSNFVNNKIMPRYEDNSIKPETTKFILAQDYNLEGTPGGITIINKEIANRMVRKFYVFYAEMMENDYKMYNEPFDISNRDWVPTGDEYKTDEASIKKFSSARRYVIKRFNNDGIISPYKLVYERWVVYENEEKEVINGETTEKKDEPQKKPSSNYIACSEVNVDGEHICNIMGKKLFDSKKDKYINEIRNKIFSSYTPKESDKSGGYYKVENNDIKLWVKLEKFDNGYGSSENNTPENNGFLYDGTNITRRVENSSTSIMGNVCNNSDICGKTVGENANGKVIKQKLDIDLNKEKLIISDLTLPMNTKYLDRYNQGTRHYRCSYRATGGKPGEDMFIEGADCYLVRDVISIVDPTFETAKQRCYCICSVIETDDPAMNFWTYTNISEYYKEN